MDFDLATGIAVIAVLAVLAYGAGRWIGARSGNSPPFFLAASLSITLCFAWSLSGNLAWAAIMPLASVVFWSNLMPVLLSLSAGLASTANGLQRWHRPATIATLAALTVAYTLTPAVRPLFAPAKTSMVSRWSGAVCLQSHSATCAPAAAATLLRSAGIPANEHLLVTHCLTSRFGTEPLGLYRGLTIASRNHASRPCVALSNADLWSQENQLPNIALVRFDRPGQTGSLRRLLGPQGDGHAIVVLGRNTQGRWMIADPAFGMTTWSDEEFQSRFTGDAIFMRAQSN